MGEFVKTIQCLLLFNGNIREVFFVSEGHRKPETYRANLCG